MDLVFVHGWGFDARFWNELSALLPQYKQHRVDLGFFGNPVDFPETVESPVLVGHSLGFIHGLKHKQDWQRWIAINSFPRFVRTETQPGCFSAAELREMRIGLASDSKKSLEAFYDKIEVHRVEGTPDTERLRAGLDELRDTDIAGILEPLVAPGLVLASRNDPLVAPKVSENLCGLAREGAIHWHETAGHVLPLRDPEWCAKAIGDFLS